MCEIATRGTAPVPLDEWDGNTFSCRMENLTHLPHHDLKSLKCQQAKDKIKKSHSFSVLTHLCREMLMKGTREVMAAEGSKIL